MTLLSTLLLFSSSLDRPYKLMVGDPAPKLSVSKWSRGEPVSSFQNGKVYVIDFFATWCEPCKRSMPVLSTLQTKYGERATFIGIDVWDYQERVPELLLQMGNKLNYRVALDDLPPIPKEEQNVPMWGVNHGPSSKDWLVASGRHEEGIPTVFVINGKGRVAWIGDNTNELAAQLARVVDGTFDIDAAAKLYAVRAAHDKQIRGLASNLFESRQAKDWPSALKYCDKLIAFEPAQGRYAGIKFGILLTQMDRKAEAYEFASSQLASSNPIVGAFSQMAMAIVSQKTPKSAEDLALAEQLAEHGNVLAQGRDPGSLEALAEVAYLKGDKVTAIRWQKTAIAQIKDESDAVAAKRRLKEYGG